MDLDLAVGVEKVRYSVWKELVFRIFSMLKCVCVYAYMCLSSYRNGPVYNSMPYLFLDKCSRTTRFATETSALLFHPVCVRADVCVCVGMGDTHFIQLIM